MAYTVLARRYRSQSFADVVGQEPVARTLRNAIASGRVAHAYLFSGTRGVGKTSMARILARALNAPATVEDAPGSDDADLPDLGVQQRTADAIMRGEDLNVIEIDGASNNSVDQARELIASAGLSPTQQARFKVYIIDEVHMLSTAAFNALLKTMEEPPAHVKFILCTTEPHKIPVTIQSRCQRFDFRDIPAAQIREHLSAVLEKEGVEADEDAVFQIAALGDGSMRDALSLLDRVVSSDEGRITTERVAELLGLAPRERIGRLIDAASSGDAGGALEEADAILRGGVGQTQLFEALAEAYRELMLAAACGAQTELIAVPDAGRAALAERAAKFDAPGLAYCVAVIDAAARAARTSPSPRAMLDATLVRLAMADRTADVAALLAGQKKKGPPGR
ncbi:MAG: DNA polymerase III subunit gamma/tau [Planctomycetota bacterium]